MWKDIREIFRAIHAISLSNFVFLHRQERIQIEPGTFLRKLQEPENPSGTVVMLRGGIFHYQEEGHSVKLACSFLPRHRVYFFEKLSPAVGPFMGEDVEKVLRHLRDLHSGKLIVLGFSMGGVLTWSYLATGKNEADLYVPVSSPINLVRFNQELHRHPIYENLYQQSLRKLNVKTSEELFEKIGFSKEDNEQHLNIFKNFMERLQETQSIWQDYCYPVNGDQDTLLKGYQEDLKVFQEKPNALIVKGGTHCCIDVIWYACLIIRNFSDERKDLISRTQARPRLLGF